MKPFAVMQTTEKPVRFERLVVNPVEGLGRHTESPENRRFEDLQPGEDKGCAGPAAPFEPSIGSHLKIAGTGIVVGLLLTHEQQQHIHRLRLEGCGEAR